MIPAGSQIGNYRVGRLLGRGGMAEVYEAEDAHLARKVALKVLPVASTDDPGMLARFGKEARAVAALNHRGIVTIFEVGHSDTHHYFSMRLLPGGDLRQRMKAGIAPDEALRILREVCGAFAHAHARGFVHRDVKPENILFDDDGFPVLTDFGIAKALDSGTQLTKTGMIVGTPRYTSPEQATGRPLDARSDLYALGVILFEMLAGKPPFDAPDAMALLQKHLVAPIPKLPQAQAALQPLIDALLAKDPSHRLASADELGARLDALAAKPATGTTAAAPPKGLRLKEAAVTPEAARQLADQLNADRSNNELRFQLLRMLFELGRTEDFLKEARLMRNAPGGFNPAQWDVVEGMGRQLAPNSPLFNESHTLNIEIVSFGEPAAEKRKQAKAGPKYTRIGEGATAQEAFARLGRLYGQVRQTTRFFTGLELDLVRAGLRATPLVPAQQLTRRLGGARIYIKREDLGHGSHAELAAAGQVYVAKALRRRRIVAGIRDLKLGVLLASAAARHGLPCDLWLDRSEYDRQSSTIFQLRRLGARLHGVQLIHYKNNDIREAALQEWLKHPDEVYWFMGLDAGPDPTGQIARDLTAVIGRETKRQLQAQAGALPDLVVARGGSHPDALGLFPAFVDDKDVRCVCVEPEESRDATGKGAEKVDFDPFGNPLDADRMTRARAILGGMHYPSIRRELAWLKGTGRIEYATSDRSLALKVHEDTAALEGILLSLDTAHAMAWACQQARKMDPEKIVVVLVTEPGEKDLWDVERLDKELRAQAGVAPSGGPDARAS